jgi:hypothetical protein
MYRRIVISASLILLVAVSAAGYLGRKHTDAVVEQTQTEPDITPEEARAALLNLGTLAVLTGGENDRIIVDLRNGAVKWRHESNVTIGKFISCNLTEKTWEMEVHNFEMHFAAGASGKFERQSDGTWRAIVTERYIS